MSEVVQVRDAEIIAAEIETIKAQTRKIMLASSVEIGRRLMEAKELVPHGNWTDWLKEKVNYSQSTADNLMRIAREYGDEQVNLFSGESKSQTFANLTYSQAVALFALPADDREAFVEENDVEDMTARQLQEAVKARQQAEREKADADKARQAAEQQKTKTESQNRELQAKLDQAYLDADKQTETVESLKQAVEDAKKEAAGPSPAELKKIRAEVREKVKAEYEKKSAQLTLEKQDAESKAKEIEEQYQAKLKQMKLDSQSILARQQAAEKKLALAAPEVEKFSVYFESLQQNFNAMRKLIGQLGQNAPETAGKLCAALKKLIESYNKGLEHV
ncbi:MAG: DUF3102 domain-containing protein [Oscillospiraceae bacterium]|nr:DUF3102 domain-containing protein [Oscillospiraceae bacterium]